jgi:hypothetical protein
MKPSIVAGIGVGLATGAWMFAEHALGLHDDPAGVGRWTGFLALVFPVLGAGWIATRTAMPTWPKVLREGLVFGVLGGLVGGAAIWLYHAAVNPGFSVDGRPVEAVTQALVGFVGALVLGTLLTLVMAAAVGRRSRAHG